MNKFFDYLEPDLPIPAIRSLLDYIRRFVSSAAGDILVEGRLGRCGFCAREEDGAVRVYWVQVGRQRIAVDALVCVSGRKATGSRQRRKSMI